MKSATDAVISALHNAASPALRLWIDENHQRVRGKVTAAFIIREHDTDQKARDALLRYGDLRDIQRKSNNPTVTTGIDLYATLWRQDLDRNVREEAQRIAEEAGYLDVARFFEPTRYDSKPENLDEYHKHFNRDIRARRLDANTPWVRALYELAGWDFPLIEVTGVPAIEEWVTGDSLFTLHLTRPPAMFQIQVVDDHAYRALVELPGGPRGQLVKTSDGWRLGREGHLFTSLNSAVVALRSFRDNGMPMLRATSFAAPVELIPEGYLFSEIAKFRASDPVRAWTRAHRQSTRDDIIATTIPQMLRISDSARARYSELTGQATTEWPVITPLRADHVTHEAWKNAVAFVSNTLEGWLRGAEGFAQFRNAKSPIPFPAPAPSSETIAALTKALTAYSYSTKGTTKYANRYRVGDEIWISVPGLVVGKVNLYQAVIRLPYGGNDIGWFEQFTQRGPAASYEATLIENPPKWTTLPDITIGRKSAVATVAEFTDPMRSGLDILWAKSVPLAAPIRALNHSNIPVSTTQRSSELIGTNGSQLHAVRVSAPGPDRPVGMNPAFVKQSAIVARQGTDSVSAAGNLIAIAGVLDYEQPLPGGPYTGILHLPHGWIQTFLKTFSRKQLLSGAKSSSNPASVVHIHGGIKRVDYVDPETGNNVRVEPPLGDTYIPITTHATKLGVSGVLFRDALDAFSRVPADVYMLTEKDALYPTILLQIRDGIIEQWHVLMPMWLD